MNPKTPGHVAYEAFISDHPKAHLTWWELGKGTQTQWELAARHSALAAPQETKAERRARRHEGWMKRTCALIDQHRRIVLKKRNDRWYLSQHTCIQSGLDGTQWACLAYAMMIEDLRWAFSLASLYGCEVWSVDANNENLRREHR